MQRYTNLQQPKNFPKLIKILTFQPNPTIKKKSPNITVQTLCKV